MQIRQIGQHGERQGGVVAEPIEGGRQRLLAILLIQPALAVAIGVGVVDLPLGHGAGERLAVKQVAQGAGKGERRIDTERQLRAGLNLRQQGFILQGRTQQGGQIRRDP